MLRKVILDERGRALVLALVALGVGMLLLPTFLAHISTNLFAAQATEVGIIEYYGADAAIEHTLWRIKCEPGFAESLPVGTSSPYSVTIGGKTVSVSLKKLSTGEGRRLLDVVLVMDCSLSMHDADGDQNYGEAACMENGGDRDCSLPGNPFQPMADAKIAANAFIDMIDSTYDQVGLVSYSTDVTLAHQLTDSFGPVKTAVDGMSASGYTNIGGAIEKATAELASARARPGATKVMLFLSDGIANVKEDGVFCGASGCSEADAYALAAAGAAADEDITIFSISLGEGADQTLMENIASEGYHAHAPSSAELQYLFESIANYLTATQYDIEATAGGTTIESRAQASKDLDMVGIITWLMK